MYRSISAPLDVQWEITPWCNHNCQHCYNYWRQNSNIRRKLTAEELERASLIGELLNQAGVFHVTLTGGEPLGVMEQIFPALFRLYQAGIHFSVNTNLVLLNDRNVKLLKSLGIKSILTSLISADESINDEITQVKGSQRRTLLGIRKAVAAGFGVSVNMVAMKKNLHTIYDTGKLVQSLGAQAFCVTKASKPSNCQDFSEFALVPEQLSQMFSELSRVYNELGIGVASLEHYPACTFPTQETLNMFGKRNCSAAKTSCTVGFNGEVRPCSHSPQSYGYITDGFRKAWENMQMWRTGELIPSTCIACQAYPRDCSGGCRVEGFNLGGSLDCVDPYSKSSSPIGRIQRQPLELLSADVAVQKHSKLRFRKEDFGYIAYVSSTSWLAIDETLFELISAQKSITTFDVQLAYHSTEDEARRTVSLLKARSLVELVKS